MYTRRVYFRKKHYTYSSYVQHLLLIQYALPPLPDVAASPLHHFFPHTVPDHQAHAAAARASTTPNATAFLPPLPPPRRRCIYMPARASKMVDAPLMLGDGYALKAPPGGKDRIGSRAAPPSCQKALTGRRARTPLSKKIPIFFASGLWGDSDGGGDAGNAAR